MSQTIYDKEQKISYNCAQSFCYVSVFREKYEDRVYEKLLDNSLKII